MGSGKTKETPNFKGGMTYFISAIFQTNAMVLRVNYRNWVKYCKFCGRNSCF